MGNRASSQKRAGKKIDDMIYSEYKEAYQIIKVLLIGTGESGKSTFTKQMKILFKGGFPEEEKLRYRDIIRANIKEDLVKLINGLEKFRGDSLPEEYRELADTFISSYREGPNISRQELFQIMELWNHELTQWMFERRHKIQISDTSDYFFNRAVKIQKKDWLPSTTDILNCRIPTNGVTTTKFKTEEESWMIVDVGGQRSERRKWMNQFESVHCVIFVAAISEYNQSLFEDLQVNRIRESLGVFEDVINNQFLRGKYIILLLNKVDLFKEKISTYPLSDTFPDVDKKKQHNLEYAKKFIKKKFLSRAKNPKRIKTFFTCATDTIQIENVFNAIRANMLEEFLKDFFF